MKWWAICGAVTSLIGSIDGDSSISVQSVQAQVDLHLIVQSAHKKVPYRVHLNICFGGVKMWFICRQYLFLKVDYYGLRLSYILISILVEWWVKFKTTLLCHGSGDNRVLQKLDVFRKLKTHFSCYPWDSWKTRLVSNHHQQKVLDGLKRDLKKKYFDVWNTFKFQQILFFLLQSIETSQVWCDLLSSFIYRCKRCPPNLLILKNYVSWENKLKNETVHWFHVII